MKLVALLRFYLRASSWRLTETVWSGRYVMESLHWNVVEDVTWSIMSSLWSYERWWRISFSCSNTYRYSNILTQIFDLLTFCHPSSRTSTYWKIKTKTEKQKKEQRRSNLKPCYNSCPSHFLKSSSQSMFCVIFH